jgi:mono/diheme cytochrome c family protein
MSVRQKFCVLVPLVVALAAVPATISLGAGSQSAPQAASTGIGNAALGKQLYRQFCGQCHALAQALAAGFGSNNGLGTLGGPSFNNLRVPYDLSIVAVTEQFGGHELVVKRMTWQQLDTVASFLASATRTNPYLARISDG